MKRITIRVADDQKAELLLELISSLDFVEDVATVAIDEPDSNGDESEAFVTLYRHPQHDLMQLNDVAFEKMHGELKAKYLGRFIAVRQGQVIDHDSDEETLIIRVRSRFPEDVVLFRKVEETLPPTLLFRSPRFANS